MKIAIVGASPIPYTRGGIENFLAGLHRAINDETDHSAELIKIPVREDTFFGLLKAYMKFYRLNLAHFDLIITVKYPCWMVQHDNIMIYLGHRLRGLYDTYPGKPETESWISGNPFRFPGPLIRKIIHSLDNWAFSPNRVSFVYCTSKTIASRAEYFHPEMPPQVIYHSTSREDFKSGTGSYILTVNRLDAPKRVDLMIKAYRSVEGEIPFIIVGAGPQEMYLRSLAATDSRIHFEGDVSEKRLLDLYAGAIAVLYTPHSEDYGLITIEAMKSGKPVITTSDSGGPLEFVRDGETGFICLPDERSLADAIQKCVANPERAAAIGQNARKIVENISWKNTAESILSPFKYWPEHRSRRLTDPLRMTVLVPYPVFPPRSGGQSRIASLYQELSKYYDIWIISAGRYGQPQTSKEMNQSLHEICVPPTSMHAKKQWEIEAEIQCEISDVALPRLIELSLNFGRAARYFMTISDIVVSSHPYLHCLIPQDFNGLIIHESHNFEYELKAPILRSGDTAARLLEDVKTAERNALTQCRFFMSTSFEEAQKLCSFYDLPPTKAIITPNGSNTDEIKPVGEDAKAASKQFLEIDGKPVVIFIGAWHPPNLEAFKFILNDLITILPELHFVIVGSVKSQYELRVGGIKPRMNLSVLGEVDDKTKHHVLQAADIALNPMFSGSGTNLKILEYFAAGIPVVSTPLGIRGLKVHNGDELLIREASEFAESLRELAGDAVMQSRLAERARAFVVANYDWKIISELLIQKIESELPGLNRFTLNISDHSAFQCGWHPLEIWPGEEGKMQKVRWSFPKAEAILPNPRKSFSLILDVQGSPNRTQLTIVIDGKEIFSQQIEPTFQRLLIPVHPIYGRDVINVLFNISAWSPSWSGSEDTRLLGMAVREIGYTIR